MSGCTWLAMVAMGLLFAPPVPGRAAGADEAADAWLPGAEPPASAGVVDRGGRFDSLAALRAGPRVAVRWTNSAAPARRVGVRMSADEPGHWAARDWREWPMTRAAESGVEVWEAQIPVAAPEVPLVYFLRESAGETNRVSALRVFRPERAGFDALAVPFLGFLDGFEEGMGGWEGPAGPGRERAMSVSTNAWSGRGALRIAVPEGRGSVTVGTPRIRGWMLGQPGVRAVRLAARTEGGTGRLRLALHSWARTGQLEIHPCAGEPEIGPEWRRVELPLEAFAGLRTKAVDWFSVQFVAASGRVVLLDDVELELR